MKILETVMLLGSILPLPSAAATPRIFRIPRDASFSSEARRYEYEGWTQFSRTSLVRGLRGGGRPNTRFSTAVSSDGKEKKKMPHALRKLGYVKSRPKKYRTPRKHYRYKYAAQKIKEKTAGGVREFKGKPEKYVGEYTGIKTSAIRSLRHDTSSYYNPDPVEPTMRRFFLPRIHRDGNLESHPYAKGFDSITKSSDEEEEEGEGAGGFEGIAHEEAGASTREHNNGPPQPEKKWKIFDENDNNLNDQQEPEGAAEESGVRGSDGAGRHLSRSERASSNRMRSADEGEEDLADGGRKKRKLSRAGRYGNRMESDETTLELST